MKRNERPPASEVRNLKVELKSESEESGWRFEMQAGGRSTIGREVAMYGGGQGVEGRSATVQVQVGNSVSIHSSIH